MNRYIEILHQAENDLRELAEQMPQDNRPDRRIFWHMLETADYLERRRGFVEGTSGQLRTKVKL